MNQIQTSFVLLVAMLFVFQTIVLQPALADGIHDILHEQGVKDDEDTVPSVKPFYTYPTYVASILTGTAAIVYFAYKTLMRERITPPVVIAGAAAGLFGFNPRDAQGNQGHQGAGLGDNPAASYYSAAETGIMRALPTQERTHFSYGACPVNNKFLDKGFYQTLIEESPIACIDILLLDPTHEHYLLVHRKNRPAQGTFWVPGGRMIKGESFFEGARRQCRKELGIEIETKEVLCVQNLIFPDSAWDNVPCHTPSIVVLAVFDPKKQSVNVDQLHSGYKWASLYEPNGIDCIEEVRKKALEFLKRSHNSH